MTRAEGGRQNARRLAHEAIERGDALGWFETLYVAAGGDAGAIPWADMKPNPNLVAWLNRSRLGGAGKKALKVGCGLGDDAEELARRGFDVVAFDIAPTAIAWCRRRFADSRVEYCVADLFDAPKSWRNGFDCVVESYTLQVLPPEDRHRAVRAIAGFVAPGGTLLAVCRGRNADDAPGNMPWPLTREELARFQDAGLVAVAFEDYMDNENPPVRRFRVEYAAPPDGNA